MFPDDYNVANPKLAPNSSSDVKVIEMTPYPGVNGTGPLNRNGQKSHLLRCFSDSEPDQHFVLDTLLKKGAAFL